MKLLLEKWHKFLKESANDIRSDIEKVKDSGLNSCYEINKILSNSFTIKSPRLKCLGLGTDKYIFSDSQKPEWVLKFEKKDPVKNEISTMETVVWSYLKGTPFEEILAPIEKEENDNFYYMKKSDNSGNYEELKNKLFEISQETKIKFKDLEYYFLSDANKNNIRSFDGKTKMIDYDDAYNWVKNNKEIIKKLKGTKNV